MYEAASKLHEYNRGIFPVSQRFVEQYPVGERSSAKYVISSSTRLPVANKMGEVIVPWMGMLTSGNRTSFDIKPISFPEITQGLMSQKWEDPQALLFSYGNKPTKSIEQAIREGGDGYDITRTLRPLSQLFPEAVAHAKEIQEILPYCQINALGHSLGGLLLMQAIMEHPDLVNAAVVINSPVRGIPKDLIRGQLFDFARDNASRLKVNEKVLQGALALIGDLFALWENKNYQKKLDEFTPWFVASGKKLIVVADKNDPLIPVESTKLLGAEKVWIDNNSGTNLLGVLPKLFGPQQELLEYALSLATAHGSGLNDQKAIEAIKQGFSENLSVPIGAFKPNNSRFPQLQPDFR